MIASHAVRKLCQPRAAVLAEAKAEGIVMLADGRQGLSEQLAVEIVRRLKQKCLVPVVHFAEILLEEPVLDGRERNHAGRARRCHNLIPLLSPIHAAGQRGDGRVLEQVARRDVENAGAPAIGHHLDTEN